MVSLAVQCLRCVVVVFEFQTDTGKDDLFKEDAFRAGASPGGEILLFLFMGASAPGETFVLSAGAFGCCEDPVLVAWHSCGPKGGCSTRRVLMISCPESFHPRVKKTKGRFLFLMPSEHKVATVPCFARGLISPDLDLVRENPEPRSEDAARGRAKRVYTHCIQV